MRVFPVRERAPATTLAFARELVGRGDVLAWFPESWRTPDGALQAFRPGIGRLLLSVEATVTPCFIAGTFAAWPRHRRWPRPARVTVKFGTAIPGAELARLGTPEAIAARLREAVAALDPAAR
jgi:long-chain acyl-CoA synthetase